MGHAGMPAEGDADGELLEQELLTLSRYLTRQMSSDPDAGLVTIVFAIDQAEELFRSDRDHAFQLQARRLTSIIARNRVPMIVIFSIRSDRFEKLQADPVLGNVRMDIFNLPPIPVNALREVIEGPARVAGLYIDPRLVERLLYDLGPDGVTDALPLLAFVLARLHQEASARSQIGLMDYQLDLMDYEELGGFRGAIELAIERALEQARVDPRAARRRDELERLLRLAFIPALVTIDPDTGLPRRRVTQLAQIPSEAHPLLKHLIQERLLVTSVEAGNTVIEIAHEAMLRQWGLLRGWLDEDLILLRVLEGVKRAARDWHLNDRNDAWLIHSSGRLEEAKRLYERPDFFSTLDSVG